jgi:hypothetical protein
MGLIYTSSYCDRSFYIYTLLSELIIMFSLNTILIIFGIVINSGICIIWTQLIYYGVKYDNWLF